MARVIPPHPPKGSPQAKAWAKKMLLARMKKASIRTAGRIAEKKFFGPHGVFAKAGHTKHLTNPTGGPFDRDAARELELYGTNNADLYRQREVPIRLNLEKKYQKGTYQSALAVKMWTYWADDAAQRYTKEFGGRGDKWFELFSPATRLHVAKSMEAFHRGEMELGNFQVKKNPGARWHEGMADAAESYGRRSPEKLEKALYKGVEVAHRDSARVARRLGLNPRKRFRRLGHPPAATKTRLRRVQELMDKGYTHEQAWESVYAPMRKPRRGKVRTFRGTKRGIRRNPIGVFGLPNPPNQVNATVAGVLYSRCMEIRAEKLKYKPGFYKHPFSQKAGVQVLALDNGDLLIHSTRGVKLWEPV